MRSRAYRLPAPLNLQLQSKWTKVIGTDWPPPVLIAAVPRAGHWRHTRRRHIIGDNPLATPPDLLPGTHAPLQIGQHANPMPQYEQ